MVLAATPRESAGVTVTVAAIIVCHARCMISSDAGAVLSTDEGPDLGLAKALVRACMATGYSQCTIRHLGTDGPTH